MLVYLFIFFSKIFENALSTLRIILVSNGKKKIGAILQGIVALVWILVTGIVIININKDPMKVFMFCIGTIIGSYLGSVIEEKLALGDMVLICITKEIYEKDIKNKLKNYNITTICEKNKNISIIAIFLERKNVKRVSGIIKNIDKSSYLICEEAKNISNLV